MCYNSGMRKTLPFIISLLVILGLGISFNAYGVDTCNDSSVKCEQINKDAAAALAKTLIASAQGSVGDDEQKADSHKAVASKKKKAASKTEKEKSKAGELNKEALQNALKGTIPDVKVVEARPSQVEGLTEVVIESRGQKGILYLDSSMKHIVSGSIIDLNTKVNFTQERFNEINKVDVATIPLDDALVLGDKNAKYRVIVFDDPE